MKIVVVMTYLDRPYQLSKTLESLRKSAHKDFEVVVVDDNSKEALRLSKYPFDVTVLRTGEKSWKNGVPAYNLGFHFALARKADIVIIQNAECYHVGDVISFAENNVKDDNYLVFGCFSIDKETTLRNHIIGDVIIANNHRARFDGDMGWYIHPIYRPAAYHFCTALTSENLKKLNGFDERFSYGYAYEDNYFVQQVNNLGLNIITTSIPNPFVVHQHHYGANPPDYARCVATNKVLWEGLRTGKEYRAKHEITKDL